MKSSFLISMLLIITLTSCNTKQEPVINKSNDSKEFTTSKKIKTNPVTSNNTITSQKNIIETKLDTTLLFRTWVSDPEGPHADFVFSRKSFYIVDYDGDGDRPYALKNNKLSIQYEDYVEEAEILYVSKDTLKIFWKGVDVPTNYTIWKG